LRATELRVLAADLEYALESMGPNADVFVAGEIQAVIDRLVELASLGRRSRSRLLAMDMDASPPGTPARMKSEAKRRPKRKPSAWNQFVKAEMPKVLKKHPRFTPQRAMTEVSKRWRSSPKNPNRRRKR